MITLSLPQYLLPPILTSSSTTQLILSWQPPAICGGWAVIEYALFMDDGNGGLFTEIDSSTVRGLPQILSHTVTTFPTSSTGKTFIFQLKEFTLGGSTTSDTIGFPLASLPTSPLSGPIIDLSVSSNYAIKIDVPAISTSGGLPITSYSIEVDDGAGGYFYSLYGILIDSLSTTYTISRDIQEGQTYRFWYRLKNEIGWSDYSPVTYAKAMAVPDVPSAPEYVSSSDTSITLLINFCSNLKGAIVDCYELYIDQGSTGSTFQKVTSYGGDVSTFTLTTSSDTALVTGLAYLFKVRAHSDAGYSNYSNSVAVTLARMQAQLSVPIFILSQTSISRITIQWIALIDRDSPGGNAIEFNVYMAAGKGGAFSKVYSVHSSSVTSFSFTGIIPEMFYLFKVSAFNLSGEGTLSDILLAYLWNDIKEKFFESILFILLTIFIRIYY